MLDSDPATGPGTATVNLAIADGIRQAVRHLLELGHRHLAHLAADVDSWTFQVRGAALAEPVAAVPGARLQTRRCALGVAEAKAVVTALPTAEGPRPTTLVSDDDRLAAGACKAARRLGARVMAALRAAVDGGAPDDVELPVTLTVRGFTGPAPAGT